MSQFHWTAWCNPGGKTDQPATKLRCVSRRSGSTKADPQHGSSFSPSMTSGWRLGPVRLEGTEELRWEMAKIPATQTTATR
jgi:hypothetical protein